MKYSFGIPAYKAKFLHECIKSVINQSFSDYELIIVNDASPENIKDIVDSFNDVRIKYFENDKNFGAENVVENWNKCLSKASGEYFILLGDDDKLELNFLSEYNVLIDKYPNLNVYHCRSKIINEFGNVIRLTEPRPEFESVYDLINQRIKEFRLQFISDFLYRTSYIKRQGGFFYLPMAWAADDITAYIAASKSMGIANTNMSIFNYRINNFSITSTGSVYLKLIAIEGEFNWLSEFVKNEVLNESDKYILEEIKKFLPIYKRKKRMNAIALSYKSKPYSTFLNYLLNHSKYNLGIVEVFKSFVFFNLYLRKS